MSPKRLIQLDWYARHKNTIGYLILAVGVAFALAGVYTVSNQTHSALCTFRTDLQRRYDDGKAFLRSHPQGIPGISRADITRSLSSQKSTLDALSSLDC